MQGVERAIRFLPGNLNRHPAPIGELESVANQVQENLPQPARVADQYLGNIRANIHGELDAFLGRPDREQPQAIADAVGEVELYRVQFELSRLDLRKIEDIVKNRHQRVRRFLHGAEAFALLRVLRGFQSQFRHSENSVHRCTDLVTHVGEELAFHQAGALRFVSGGRQVRIGPANGGDYMPANCQMDKCAGDHECQSKHQHGHPALLNGPSPDGAQLAVQVARELVLCALQGTLDDIGLVRQLPYSFLRL